MGKVTKKNELQEARQEDFGMLAEEILNYIKYCIGKARFSMLLHL